MPVDFPDNPVVGQKFTLPDQREFTWNNWAWQRGHVLTTPPMLTSINPTSASVAEQTHTLTLNGDNFNSATLAAIDGVNVPTTFVLATQLTCSAILTAGVHSVTAQRYGLESAALNFTVGEPTLTAIAPTTAKSTDTTLTLTLTGNYFHASSVVHVNNAPVATTFVSMTQLTATLNPKTLGHGTWSVEVRTGSLVTARHNLVVAMVPQVISVTPLVGTQNEALTLTANGIEFSAGDKIIANGVALTTTFVSATKLTASYTSPYFDPVELGQLDVKVNVATSPSPDQIVNFLEPRFKIRSTFPINYSDIAPQNWEVELWGWGVISDQSVAHINGIAQQTWVVANVVGTELILMMHMDLTPYPNDTQVMITVLNEGGHWSPDPPWPFWIERFG